MPLSFTIFFNGINLVCVEKTIANYILIGYHQWKWKEMMICSSDPTWKQSCIEIRTLFAKTTLLSVQTCNNIILILIVIGEIMFIVLAKPFADF